jgi:tRNA G37 N-methylase Trm5
LKSWLLPSGRSPRQIRFGLLGGLTMQLDFAHHSQRWLGLQEVELLHWLRRFARDINTAVDVGANDGMYTLYFLARTPAHKIYSFEPSPDCVGELKENIALNNLADDPRLEIVPLKVGAACAEGWTTLDSIVSTIIPPCLVKVDIDGGERDFLSGASRCLSLPDIRWIVEVHSKALEQECLQALNEAGYRVVIVHNAWWRHVIPELRPGELNHWLVAYRDGENEKSFT